MNEEKVCVPYRSVHLTCLIDAQQKIRLIQTPAYVSEPIFFRGAPAVLPGA